MRAGVRRGSRSPRRRRLRHYVVVLIRTRTPHDMDDLVELATTVRAVDDYPVYLPDGDLVRFLTRPTPLAAWVAEAAGRRGRPRGHELALESTGHGCDPSSRNQRRGRRCRSALGGPWCTQKRHRHPASRTGQPVRLHPGIGNPCSTWLRRRPPWLFTGGLGGGNSEWQPSGFPGQTISELVFASPE